MIGRTEEHTERTTEASTQKGEHTIYAGKVLRLPASGLCSNGPSRTPLFSITSRSLVYALRFFLPISPEPEATGSQSFLIHRAHLWRSVLEGKSTMLKTALVTQQAISRFPEQGLHLVYIIDTCSPQKSNFIKNNSNNRLSNFLQNQKSCLILIYEH